MASLVATAQTGDAQLEDLRSKLDGLLRDADAYGKIREALDDAGAKENRGQGLQKDALLRRLMAAAEGARRRSCSAARTACAGRRRATSSR